MDWFNRYKDKFEQAVVAGIQSGVLGIEKSVPILPGKLSRKRIGKILGEAVLTDEPIVIDYYGYMKKSNGFQTLVNSVIKEINGQQVKMISVPVVHFNSIRLEVMAKIAPELVQEFGNFKKAVLDAREFAHNYKA